MAQNASDQMDVFQTNDSTTPRRAPAGNIQILRLPQVCKMTGLCRSSVYQMEAEGQFPRRIKIGARSVGWIESEVQNWLRQRIESDQPRNP
jgi:prophage regulatory protein